MSSITVTGQRGYAVGTITIVANANIPGGNTITNTTTITVNGDTAPQGPRPVYGCTDSAASNFNPNATVNDGSCVYPNNCPSAGTVLNIALFPALDGVQQQYVLNVADGKCGYTVCYSDNPTTCNPVGTGPTGQTGPTGPTALTCTAGYLPNSFQCKNGDVYASYQNPDCSVDFRIYQNCADSQQICVDSNPMGNATCGPAPASSGGGSGGGFTQTPLGNSGDMLNNGPALVQ